VKKQKVIKYGTQSYVVQGLKIVSISYEIGEKSTCVFVRYAGRRYSEKAFVIPNTHGKVNHELLSDTYVAIMALNDELLKKKGF